MDQVPKEIRKLVEKRRALRAQKQYAQSDRIRAEIERMGYEVRDTAKGSRLSKKNAPAAPKESFLAVFGSGEIAPSAVQAHSRVLEGIGMDAPRIVVVSTPAGFQPNVKVVCEEIADFFAQHLQNYHPRVEILYANRTEHTNNQVRIRSLKNADYIFIGPGSPTYAVHHLRGSRLLDSIKERIQAGASLGLASAAAIAFSRFALPVYEIYKAGCDLYWEEGLNFFAHVWKEITVIPHFNNKEGGKKNDTSRCWMGKKRFAQMLTLLPPNQTLWGIDEHTAVLINRKKKTLEVVGKGRMNEL